jgi:molecular chaperone Hsp33
MSDYLVKAIDKTRKLRLLTVSATDLVNQAQLRHNTWQASTAALGRTLIGTLLLAAAELTDKEELTARVLGNGPAGGIIATAKADFTVKGYIQNPHVQLPSKKPGHIDVAGAVGKKGFLEITKDLGLKEPYTGQVPLISGEIAQDFTYYLAKSEQIPSATGLSVFVNPDETVGAAGGFMLEAMPGASDELITQVTERIQKLPALSQLFLKKTTPEELAKLILGDDCKLLEKDPVMYLCDCSKEKYAKILATLKPSELTAMADEDHGCELTCKFCGNKYHFTEQELRDIIASQEDA